MSARIFVAVAVSFVAAVRIAAGPLDEVRAASSIQNLDLEKLRGGEIANARGPLGDFARGVYVESCYFLRAPPPVVIAAMQKWDPTRHRELEVSAFRDYALPSTPAVFNSLILNSGRPQDRWLIDKTFELAKAGETELHLNAGDMALVRSSLGQESQSSGHGDAKVSEVWRTILHRRSEALGTGGLAAVPSYRAADTEIAARAEFEALLKMAPAIAARFASLTNGRPFSAAGLAPDSTNMYWEASLVRGHTGLHNGVLCTRKNANSWQAVDLSYYVSDTYILSMTLYEIWPSDRGTLLWQIDFVSAPFHNFGNAVERTFAGRELLKEAAQWIRLFRSDLERR